MLSAFRNCTGLLGRANQRSLSLVKQLAPVEASKVALGFTLDLRLFSTSTMSDFDYDMFVIGAGSGGVRCARFAAGNYGMKVAVAELPFDFVSEAKKRGGAGGTCVIRGCVPKKLFIYGSHIPEELKTGEAYGWKSSGELSLDWEKLVATKNTEIRRLNGIYDKLLANAKVDKYEGFACLTGPNSVEVNGKSYSAKNIVVATGGRAFKPNIPGVDLPGVVTSDEALVLPEKPKRIIVVGGGYIAVEFAGFFNGYGSDTTLMFRADLPLRGFDGSCRQFLADRLTANGIKVKSGLNPSEIKMGADGKTLEVHTKEGPVLEADVVMFATGRKPNTIDLGLEKVGVALKPSGAIDVDEFSRTSVPSIYAVGDVTNRLNLTPVALMEGMALAKTLSGMPTKPDHALVPTAVFSQPPIGTVGLTEEEAAEQYAEVDVYESTFTPMKYTMMAPSPEREKAYMKLMVDKKTDKVIGVHMVGVDAAEIIQGIGVALKAGATKATFDATVGIHPSTAEEFVTMRTKARTIGNGKEATGPLGGLSGVAAAVPLGLAALFAFGRYGSKL